MGTQYWSFHSLNISSSLKCLLRFLDSLPIPMRDSFMRRERQKRDADENETTTEASNPIHCHWNIKVHSKVFLMLHWYFVYSLFWLLLVCLLLICPPDQFHNFFWVRLATRRHYWGTLGGFFVVYVTRTGVEPGLLGWKSSLIALYHPDSWHPELIPDHSN